MIILGMIKFQADRRNRTQWLEGLRQPSFGGLAKSSTAQSSLAKLRVSVDYKPEEYQSNYQEREQPLEVINSSPK